MTQSVLAQAANITVIGMGVVFVFLVVLIGLMYALGAVVQVLEKYFPQTVPAAATDNAVIAVAIAAAKKFQGK